ncbi:MAG: hypothetical protein ACPGWR_00005 [Ardenticatenaceae bacterium]
MANAAQPPVELFQAIGPSEGHAKVLRARYADALLTPPTVA